MTAIICTGLGIVAALFNISPFKTIFLMKINKKLLQEIIDYNNDGAYVLTKAAEECSELTTILLQKLLKPAKVDNQDVIDEIGDVYIRLKMLTMQIGKEKVQARIDYKLAKYAQYLNEEKYDKI